MREHQPTWHSLMHQAPAIVHHGGVAKEEHPADVQSVAKPAGRDLEPDPSLPSRGLLMVTLPRQPPQFPS